MFRFLPVSIILLICTNSFGQIDQKKLDSFSNAIDSSTKSYKAWQDSFNKVQDSIYRSSISTDLEQNTRNLNYFLAEQKRREQKERRQTLIRLAASGIIFTVLVIVLVRRRKQKT